MSALTPGDFAGTGTHKPARRLCAWAQFGPWKGGLLRAGLVSLLALEPLLCSAETTAVKQQPGPATLPGKAPGSESAASASVAATPGNKGVAVNATCNLPVKPSAGKVVEIYWTQGPENRRVVGREADHYVDLNLIVKTVGYRPGECIEATIQSENAADEIADSVKKIVLRGKVDETGLAYFKTPLKDYTLNLQGSEP
ncbi:hypothetical protein [Pseudomonas sp. MWU349]|uniref:hypothetical protein n=1 Tax=Pseudomonas sp. MWU349 TaxID=2802572 RepID=UPI001B326EE3|nr:hypothetical protein [Pseudomonas sp. MWU349]